MKTYEKPKETIKYLQIDKKMYTNIFFQWKNENLNQIETEFSRANKQKKEKQTKHQQWGFYKRKKLETHTFEHTHPSQVR